MWDEGSEDVSILVLDRRVHAARRLDEDGSGGEYVVSTLVAFDMY